MFKTEEALAIIGGHVDEELLLRNEYLAIENEILRKKISGRIKLSQRERMRLATIGKKDRDEGFKRSSNDCQTRDNHYLVS